MNLMTLKNNLMRFRYLSDIRFWLIVFFCFRLYGISDAPLEISHNWRQITVNMIARNYYEETTTFFYPMMDNAGEKSGITGTEFPLLNYLIFIFAKLFGWQHWYGRLINLIVSSIGIWYFYRWIKEFLDSKSAFPAAMILITSLWFAFSRKIMPDTFSLSLTMISLFYGYKYVYEEKTTDLLIYLALGSLGVLCKLPAIIVLSPVFILFIKKWIFEKRFSMPLFLSSACILALCGVWYIYWFNHLIAIGDWQFYMMGPGFPAGLYELGIDFYETFDNIFFESIKFSGFTAFIIGLIMLLKVKRNNSLLPILLLWLFLFFLFMIQAGYGYATHDYYTLPLVPALALGAGYALSFIKKSHWQYVVLCLIMTEGLLNVLHDFKIKKEHQFYISLSSFADKHVPKSSLVVCDEGMNPRMLYYLHRKGWSLEPGFIQRKGVMDSLSLKGAEYFISLNKNKTTYDLPLIAETNDVKCYKLKGNQ
jgi:4-amino-4-deoxy-L-arabinose transferase-like glycosyltransferase